LWKEAGILSKVLTATTCQMNVQQEKYLQRKNDAMSSLNVDLFE